MKKWLLKNPLLHIIASFLLALYLKFVYLTTSWRVVNAKGENIDFNLNLSSFIIAFWHNRLALLPYIIPKLKKVKILSSSHRDGRIIARVCRFFGAKAIYGSTNRNAFLVLKEIINVLKKGENILITPDGPRGPMYKFNSNLAGAARLGSGEILLLGVYISKYIELKTWDKFMFPLPFAKAIIVVDHPFKIEQDQSIDYINQFLEERLNSLGSLAQKLIK